MEQKHQQEMVFRQCPQDWRPLTPSTCVRLERTLKRKELLSSCSLSSSRLLRKLVLPRIPSLSKELEKKRKKKLNSIALFFFFFFDCYRYGSSHKYVMPAEGKEKGKEGANKSKDKVDLIKSQKTEKVGFRIFKFLISKVYPSPLPPPIYYYLNCGG
jgi:hypothetical protein